jgi:phosphoribosylformylglycinamidine synthase
MSPPILILHATGANRDRDVAWACEWAGGAPEIVHINRLVAGDRNLLDYRMLVLPGGFSYGDDLGAGKLWAVALRHRLAADLAEFVAAGRPVLGICNGFQALVKSGLLPGLDQDGAPALSGAPSAEQSVTLTRNDSNRFECRWVYLSPQANSPCIFTRNLNEPIYCPVAHGEGKFVARDADLLNDIEAQGLVVLRYTGAAGQPVGYPGNPNGSQANIAGICNPQGNILGLMPHPENHLLPQHHPHYRRGQQGFSGLPLFQNGVKYASEL